MPDHDADKKCEFVTQTKCTCSLTMAGCTPKKGSVAEPGLAGHTPGRGASTWAPVSVCQYVSTMGHSSPPTTCTMQHSLACLIVSPHMNKISHTRTICIMCNKSSFYALFDSMCCSMCLQACLKGLVCVICMITTSMLHTLLHCQLMQACIMLHGKNVSVHEQQ